MRAIAALTVLFSSAALAQSTGWVPKFGEGVSNASSPGSIRTYACFDPDGPEPQRLVVAGSFTAAGAISSSQVAAWDGSHWIAMDEGLSGETINALHWAFSSRELYAGGVFQGHAFFGRWNGSAWETLPPVSPTIGFQVQVDYLHAFDRDGSGPAPERIIAAASRTSSFTGTSLYEWDGVSWRLIQSPVGPFSHVGRATDMTVLHKPDGTTDLYVAVSGVDNNGYSRFSLIRYNGDQVTIVASDACTPSCFVALNALEVVNDLPGGSGALYVAGTFTQFAGVPAIGIARWNGQTWQAADSGLGAPPSITDLTVFDVDGPGFQPPRLVAALYSYTPASPITPSIRAWNGTSWSSPLFTTFDVLPHRIIPFNDGSSSLFAMGGIAVTGNNFTSRISRSTGSTLSGSIWAQVGYGLNNSVHAFASVPVQSGSIASGVYAAGTFYTAGKTVANGVARWDGARWFPLLPSFINNHVNALAFGSINGNTRLFLGGKFTFRVAEWDGVRVNSLGQNFNGDVNALLVANNALYIGGGFTGYEFNSLPHIARWNGSSWSGLGIGINGPVYALAEQNGQIYAGGAFTTAGGFAASGIAQWNGFYWAALGQGLNGTVRALAIYDNGTGSALIAGGDFTMSGSVAVNHIARFEAGAWKPLGVGFDGPVFSLTVLDPDGAGPWPSRLYAGGHFTYAGEDPVNNVAEWRGTSWASLSQGVDGRVRALTTIDTDGAGPQPPSIFLGGDFRSAGGASSPHIAEYALPNTCYANCDDSTSTPVLSANDLLCFITNFAAANPYANCDASTGTPALTANDFTCFLSFYFVGCP